MSVDVSTRQQLWKDMAGNQIDKAAELAGTYDMPNAVPPSVKDDTKTRKTVIDKEASVDDLLKVAFEAPGKTEPDDNEASVKGEQKDAPQGKALKPHVDVSGQEPPTLIHEKKAQYYALPSMETYPLDGYDQVEKAAAYFEEWGKRMPPEMRHEYCVNLVKRASALGIPVSETAERYGSETFAPDGEIKMAMDARKTVLLDDEKILVLDKLASKQPALSPDDFAGLLSDFDRWAGLTPHYGGDVPDPYFSTFGKTASKQESKIDPDESIIIGNEYVTKRKLVELANSRQEALTDRFGVDFAKEFRNDPLTIFNSLPRDQKLVLMRMAHSNKSMIFGASTS